LIPAAPLLAALALAAARPAAAAEPERLFVLAEPRVVFLGGSRAYANVGSACGGVVCLGAADGTGESVGRGTAPSFRLGAGYRVGPRSAVTVSASWLEASGTDRLSAPGAVVGRPVPAVNEILANTGKLSDSAAADDHVRMVELVSEYTGIVASSRRFDLVAGAGLRYLFFDDDLHARYLHSNTGYTFSKDVESRTSAAGPQASLRGEWRADARWTASLGLTLGALLGPTLSRHSVCQGPAFAQPGCSNYLDYSASQSLVTPFVALEPSLTYAFGDTGARAAIGLSVENYWSRQTKPDVNPDGSRRIDRESVQPVAALLRVEYAF